MCNEEAKILSKPSATGSQTSLGLTGERSRSKSDAPGPASSTTSTNEDGGSVVRAHRGETFISVSGFLELPALPGTFTVLKLEDLAGYMVTHSCVLTSTQYATMKGALQRHNLWTGDDVLVGLKFASTTPNLALPITAEST